MDLHIIKSALAGPIRPVVQNSGRTKLAAVLIILYGKEASVLMTERPKTMNHHAGEISFPGGTWHMEDADLLETALRETKEEIGIEFKREEVVGQLKPVTTLNSGFTIIPFITIKEKIPEPRPNSEIESILHMPLALLLKTMEEDKDPLHKSIQEMYTFKFQNHLIWGASARMLRQIVDILSGNGLF